MTFNLPELKAFIAVARLGNFTRASGHLNLSQPALSRRIGLLEAALGAPLFDRFRDGVQLTDTGRAFLPHAEAALAALEDGVETIQRAARGESGRIQLAISGALCNKSVVRVLSAFRRSYAGVELSIQAGTSVEVSELVMSSQATLGLRCRADPNKRLSSRVIGTENFVVVCAPDHALAKGKAVTRAQLNNETWIVNPARRGKISDSLYEIFKAQGLNRRSVMVIDNTFAQRRFLEAGLGVALLPYGSVQEEIERGNLCIISTEAPVVSVPVAITYRKGVSQSKSVRNLVALLTAAFPKKTGSARGQARHIDE